MLSNIEKNQVFPTNIILSDNVVAFRRICVIILEIVDLLIPFRPG